MNSEPPVTPEEKKTWVSDLLQVNPSRIRKFMSIENY